MVLCPLFSYLIWQESRSAYKGIHSAVQHYWHATELQENCAEHKKLLVVPKYAEAFATLKKMFGGNRKRFI